MSLISFATDTFATGTRGAPNAWSPGSDFGTWTQQSGNQTASIASSQGVLTYNTNTNIGVWTYSTLSEADQEVLVNITQGTSNSDLAGAVLRWGSGPNYYYANIGDVSGKVEIAKNINGSVTSLVTNAFSSSFGTKYTMRFQAIGNTLKVRVWASNTTEPTTWTAQVTDSDLSSGYFGICAAPVSSSTCAFDTFSASNGYSVSLTPVPQPTVVVALEQLGLVAGASNADLVPSTDISNYVQWSLAINALSTGGTVTFQGSNDNANWYTVPAYTSIGVLTTVAATTGIYWGPRTYRYLRARLTSWASGTTNANLQLHTTSAGFVAMQTPAITGTVTANAGTNLNTSTLAKESGGNLDTLVARLPVKGQATMANSTPVAIASDQTIVPLRSEVVSKAVAGQLYYATTGQMSSASGTVDAPLSFFNTSGSGKNILIFDITASSGTGSLIGMLFATTTDPAYGSTGNIQNASLGGSASAIASHVTYTASNTSLPGSGALRHIYGQYTVSLLPAGFGILLPSGSSHGISVFMETYAVGIGGISAVYAEY